MALTKKGWKPLVKGTDFTIAFKNLWGKARAPSYPNHRTPMLPSVQLGLTVYCPMHQENRRAPIDISAFQICRVFICTMKLAIIVFHLFPEKWRRRLTFMPGGLTNSWSLWYSTQGAPCRPAPWEVWARAECLDYMNFSQNEKSCVPHLHTRMSTLQICCGANYKILLTKNSVHVNV